MKRNIFNFIKTACVVTTLVLFCSCREGNQNEGTNTTNDTGSQNYGETEGAKNAQGVDAEGAGGSGSENNTGAAGNSTDNTTNGNKGTTSPTSTGVNNPATVKDNTGTGNRQQ